MRVVVPVPACAERGKRPIRGIVRGLRMPVPN